MYTIKRKTHVPKNINISSETIVESNVSKIVAESKVSEQVLKDITKEPIYTVTRFRNQTVVELPNLRIRYLVVLNERGGSSE